MEPFQVVVFLFGIVIGRRPYFFFSEFLDDQHIVFKMIAQVEIGGTEMPRFGDLKDLILPGKLSQEETTCIGIQSHYVLIEPDFSASQRRDSLFFYYDFLNREFRQDITLGIPALDG